MFLSCCCCCQVASVVSDSVWPHRQQPTRLHRPWDSPGKNTGVGCHFLLQCMKVKSESEVIQSCRTFRDPMDSSLPGSSIHGIFQARVMEWVAIAFSSFCHSEWFIIVKAMVFPVVMYGCDDHGNLGKTMVTVVMVRHNYLSFILHLGTPQDYMEKAMAPHSSTLAWKIPWAEEPGRLQSMGSLRVGHDWATSLSLFAFTHWRRKWQRTPVFLPGESQGQRSLVGCCLWGCTELDTTEAT